ncbi:MAG: helix-turn-helix transcriptional regulator [Ktedonobacteraceae bacterium]
MHKPRIPYRLKVREIAEGQGISMGKLSRMADVDRTTVKRLYDDPSYSPNLETIWRVAKALGVTLNDLVEDHKIDEE